MKHPTAIDAFEIELRRAKEYLDTYAERPDRWVCVRLLRRVLKTSFAAISEVDRLVDERDRWKTAAENYQREAFNLSAGKHWTVRRIEMADGSAWDVCPSCLAGAKRGD